MIGYGPEEEGFALELTYNYGIDGYKNGDDLQYICLQLDVEATKAKAEAEGRDDGVRFGVYTTETWTISIFKPRKYGRRLPPQYLRFPYVLPPKCGR